MDRGDSEEDEEQGEGVRGEGVGVFFARAAKPFFVRLKYRCWKTGSHAELTSFLVTALFWAASRALSQRREAILGDVHHPLENLILLAGRH